MKRTFKALLATGGLALAGTAGFAHATALTDAVNNPNCTQGSPTQNCITYDNFNVFSLPILNLQAGADSVPSPGDPAYVSSTFGKIKTETIIGINNGQSTSTGNPPGSVDGAENTPSQNNAKNTTFTTLTAPDPGGAGEFVGDLATSWDAKTQELLTLSGGTPLTAFFAFNETGSGTGLLTTDLLIWVEATLCDYNPDGTIGANGCQNFFLQNGTTNTTPPDVSNLPAADGSDANGSGAGNCASDSTLCGYGPWVYVHAGVCVSSSGQFLGFPDSSGNCASGSVANQNNLGQNAAAFMVNSPGLDTALQSGMFNTLNVIWEMGYINGGGETAWIQSLGQPNLAPEPNTLAILGLSLLAMVGVSRARAKRH